MGYNQIHDREPSQALACRLTSAVPDLDVTRRPHDDLRVPSTELEDQGGGRGVHYAWLRGQVEPLPGGLGRRTGWRRSGGSYASAFWCCRRPHQGLRRSIRAQAIGIIRICRDPRSDVADQLADDCRASVDGGQAQHATRCRINPYLDQARSRCAAPRARRPQRPPALGRPRPPHAGPCLATSPAELGRIIGDVGRRPALMTPRRHRTTAHSAAPRADPCRSGEPGAARRVPDRGDDPPRVPLACH
jgi:hypothetical protein